MTDEFDRDDEKDEGLDEVTDTSEEEEGAPAKGPGTVDAEFELVEISEPEEGDGGDAGQDGDTSPAAPPEPVAATPAPDPVAAADAAPEEAEEAEGEDAPEEEEDDDAPFDTNITEAHIADMLTELGEIAGATGLRSLEREVIEERLPSLSAGKVTLVVLGEFNHGKSTVVNALLGDDVLPVGITPTTAVITHLVHGEERKVTIKPPHGAAPFEIDYDDMERAVRESGDEGNEPEYVEIAYPNAVLGHSLVLVDTPGVNDISRQKVEITYGYLPRADVILYVLDATQVLKKSEVTFIRDRLLKANRDRIIFVLNKVDALSPEDVAEVESYARERLTDLIGPVELHAFSGRRALEAQRAGEDVPAAFATFQDSLIGFVKEQRAFIILDSALAGGLRVGALLEQNLAIKRQGYQLEQAELERRIASVRAKLKQSRRLIASNIELIDERVSGIAATARHNLRVFTEQFVEQLPIQIERAEARDVKRHLPSFIQDTFKEWLESEGQAVARNLEELAEEVIEITNESLREAVETYREAFGLAAELDLDVDTISYDVSVFALGAFGVSVFFLVNAIVGSLLTLSAPLLAFFLRDKIDDRIKERAREEGVKAIEGAGEKLEEELLRVIHDYGDRLKAFVETAGDRLYRQIEEALEQVQIETQGDVDRAELLTTVDERLASTRKVIGLIQKSREQLSKDAVEAGF
jgi:small GTP-binding protein